MKKEFGKWLMDIAKYLMTVAILSSIITDMDKTWLYYLSLLFFLTSSLKKYVFYNLLINSILYLCVT